MRTVLIPLSLAMLGTFCAQPEKKTPLTYPETAKVEHVDEYFGHKVEDPYRWLENDTSAATAE